MSRFKGMAVLVAIVAGGLWSASAIAADAEQGRRLYQRWCVQCHGSLTSATRRDVAPPLSSIVAKESLSAAALRTWLANPHPPMPNFNLGRIEIEDIVAYLVSLKGR